MIAWFRDLVSGAANRTQTLHTHQSRADQTPIFLHHQSIDEELELVGQNAAARATVSAARAWSKMGLSPSGRFDAPKVLNMRPQSLCV